MCTNPDAPTSDPHFSILEILWSLQSLPTQASLASPSTIDTPIILPVCLKETDKLDQVYHNLPNCLLYHIFIN